MPPLLLKLVFLRIPKARAPWYARPIIRGLARNVQASFIDPELERSRAPLGGGARGGALVRRGGASAADIQMSFPVEVTETRAPDALGPKTRAFLARIRERAAYQRARQAGGEFRIPG